MLLAGEDFPRQMDLVARVRGILYRHGLGTTIVGQDDALIRHLLALHPRAAEKIGSGIAAFRVVHGLGRGPHRPRRFLIERTDGSTIDFSYLKCVAPQHEDRAVHQAMRVAIREQIVEFRRRALEFHPSCAVTGVLLTREDADVDHHPIPFRELVIRFASVEKLALHEFRLLDRADGFGKVLADEEQIDRWTAFHLAHARLRLVLTEAHRRLPRDGG